MGITTVNSRGQKTLVDGNGQTSFGIGIGDYPVTPLDQATGFATLANGGVANRPYLVDKAIASDGEVVYSHKAQQTRALDWRVANDVTLTLEPVAAWSNDALANGRVSAAKTGTEGVSPTSLNNSDAWMVGYTPQVSAAVWVGTGYNRPIFNAYGQPLYGANLPGETWKLFMDTYLAGKPNLPMATKQMIGANGKVPVPTPTVTPSPTQTKTTSTPSPTFSVTSGFPTSASPLPSTSPVSSPTASPSPTCTSGLIGHTCTSSSSPAAGP
jgi:membrane peptidoglycan carboxypeptidase